MSVAALHRHRVCATAHLVQPWSTKVQIAVKERKTQLLIAYASDLAMWSPLLHTKFKDTEIVTLGKPSLKLRYPANKRRTRINIETLRAAETSLDAFWKVADEQFQLQAGTIPHEVVGEILVEQKLVRTAPWSGPEKTSPDAAVPKSTQYINIPFSNTLHDPAKQITGVFAELTLTQKEKIKTHGTQVLTHEALYVAARPEPEEDCQPSFYLDKRAHKVFQTLFHCPMSRNQPGDTPRTDFLHAMVSTGFSAQKLQGSAWQFTPHNLVVEQPIQFHEPHPNHKLPFT
jgi:hypothetical protein